MSTIGKFGLFLSSFSLIIFTSTSWILGGWIPVLYGFVVLFFVGILASLIFDRKLYFGFLLMRTTKNGISVGASIFITLILCVSVAYLSKHFEISTDITEEKINSLAPQTQKILKNLKEEIKFIVFYQGASGIQKRKLIKRNLFLFKTHNSQVKVFYYDAYLNNKLAQKYLNDIADKNKQDVFLFVEYKGNRVLIASPFNEAKITSALIKVTRREKRTIYFLTGHGEKDLLNKTATGISILESALTRASFKVKTWNFIINGNLPKDISVLIIAGPQKPYEIQELQWLEQYLKSGGRVLIALDPGMNTNLLGLLKKFNIHYKNHFIKDSISRLMGLGSFSTLGIHFDSQHVVTQSIAKGNFFISHLTSDLGLIKKDTDNNIVTALIKTDIRAESRTSIDESSKAKAKKESLTMALLVESKKPVKAKKESDKKNISTMLAVFGDSDFLSNLFITRGVNQDLSMNVISYLIDESDLVSIRPKKLKATSLILKQSDRMIIILFVIALPIIFFIFSLVIWFRRREA